MSLQQTLFDKPLPFGGQTYDLAKDGERLTGQFYRVRDLMLTGEWYTLGKLQELVGGSEAGISARVRDLRKPAFGGYEVERRRVEGGLYEYRIKND